MDVFLAILSCLMKILHFVAHPIYLYRSKSKKILPKFDKDLLTISATDLAEKIRRKQISSEEICTTYINRIKEVNPFLNAIVEERFEEALKEAKNVDYYLTKTALTPDDLKKIKPLLGIPLTVKESCSVQGMSLSGGTKGRNGYKAESDGELVSRLKASGAIPLLVSNTPELCLSWESHNFVTGTTNNPYDTTCTSAGSSGGEGALLGAGASLVGVGSDIGGSIRLPAMFNGVFGHKPTPSIVPLKGHYPSCQDPKFNEYLVIGPLTRYAKDLKTMMKIMVGKKATELKLNEEVSLKDLNVFFLEEAGFSFALPSVDSEIKHAIRKCVDHLDQKCGSKIVRNCNLDIRNTVAVCVAPLFTIQDIPNVLKPDNQNLGVELFKSLIGQSEYTLNVLYFYLLQLIYRTFVGDYTVENVVMRKQFIETLGDNGVLILPTFTNAANKHHEFYFQCVSVMYLVIANSFGLPATHVPCGLNKKGLPIGVQVIAGPNQDRLCFAVAEELERAFGGWTPPN